MNRYTKTLLTMTAVLAALPACGGEVITRNVPTGDAPKVRIICPAGDVVVTGERSDSVDIVAELGGRNQRLDVTERGRELLIEVVKTSPGGSWRNDGTDLTVSVPEATTLTVEAASADIEVAEVRGELRIETASGDLDVETFGGRLKAKTVSGDVSVVGHLQEGEAWVYSTSGDVEVSELAGRLEATAVSGDVTITDGKLDRVVASTTSGDVFIHGLRGNDTDIEAGAVSGDVEVALGPDFGGRIDISTLNGSIDNCFGPKAQRTSRYGPGRTLNFDHGTGRGRVKIETVNGSVDICIE